MGKFYNKIEELYTLQANWDGYGAREEAIKYIEPLLLDVAGNKIYVDVE